MCDAMDTANDWSPDVMSVKSSSGQSGASTDGTYTLFLSLQSS